MSRRWPARLPACERCSSDIAGPRDCGVHPDHADLGVDLAGDQGPDQRRPARLGGDLALCAGRAGNVRAGTGAARTAAALARGDAAGGADGAVPVLRQFPVRLSGRAFHHFRPCRGAIRAADGAQCPARAGVREGRSQRAVHCRVGGRVGRDRVAAAPRIPSGAGGRGGGADRDCPHLRGDPQRLHRQCHAGDRARPAAECGGADRLGDGVRNHRRRGIRVGCRRPAGVRRQPAPAGRSGLSGDCRFGRDLPALLRADPRLGAGQGGL